MPILPPDYYEYDIVFPDHIVNSPISWNTINPNSINGNINKRKATLGRVLFYDKLLSASNEVACASCHKQEFSFADNQSFSEGINGTLTTRNSPNLNDVGWASTFGSFGNLFWDCRASNLEDMVLLPIEHEGELGKDMEYLLTKLANTNYYPELFDDAFGTPHITATRIGEALANFVRSMSTFNTHFDKVQAEEAGFTDAQRNGFLIFKSNCTGCHDLAHFGTFFPSNTGLDSVCVDAGMATWTGDSTQNCSFRSPSLRNIALTAPYMHDGRFATLDDVLDFYSEGILPHPNSFFQSWNGGDFTGFNFSDQNKLDLKHFLLTLTDSTFINDIRFSDPFTTPLADHEVDVEKSITITPNPFSDATTVCINAPMQGNYSVRLMDLNGKVIQHFEMKGTKTFVVQKTDVMRTGIYLLELQNGRQRWVEKLVVE
jgi:cytochrome c peroxidase